MIYWRLTASYRLLCYISVGQKLLHLYNSSWRDSFYRVDNMPYNMFEVDFI